MHPRIQSLMAELRKDPHLQSLDHQLFRRVLMDPAISITSHQPGGTLTGATPDGRRAHEICADGTVSPMQGRDTLGPTAVMRSALLIDHDLYQATLMNMKFHPSALRSEEDLQKLSDLLFDLLFFKFPFAIFA